MYHVPKTAQTMTPEEILREFQASGDVTFGRTGDPFSPMGRCFRNIRIHYVRFSDSGTYRVFRDYYPLNSDRPHRTGVTCLDEETVFVQVLEWATPV